jgi:hypothetical protein
MNESERPKESDRKIDQGFNNVSAQESTIEELAALYRIEKPAPPIAETPSITNEEDQLTSLSTSPAGEEPRLNEESFAVGLSPEEQEQINDRFLKLKNIFETSGLSEEAKRFFLDSDVSAVIAGIKPMSYVQPQLEEKKWGFIKKNAGLSNTDLEALQSVSQQLGILTLRNDKLEAERNEDRPYMKNIALMLVINLQKTVDAMRASGTYSEEEIAKFTQDPIAEQHKRLSDGKPDYISNYRTGYQLGYPSSDVKKFIRYHELKMKPASELTDAEQNFLNDFVSAKKGINVSGLQGDGVAWATTNPESPDTQQFKTKLEQTFAIQKSVFNY